MKKKKRKERKWREECVMDLRFERKKGTLISGSMLHSFSFSDMLSDITISISIIYFYFSFFNILQNNVKLLLYELNLSLYILPSLSKFQAQIIEILEGYHFNFIIQTPYIIKGHLGSNVLSIIGVPFFLFRFMSRVPDFSAGEVT